MSEPVKQLQVVRIQGERKSKLKDTVIREIPLTLFLNTEKIGVLFCTPCKIKSLVVGFIFSQGIIKDKQIIKQVYFNSEKKFAQVIVDLPQDRVKEFCSPEKTKNMYLSSCGICSFRETDSDIYPGNINSSLKVKSSTLFQAMQDFEEKSHLFKLTGANHSCGVHNGEKIEAFAEDIGRHNAVDKVIGECWLRGIETRNKLLLVSGRISWEIITKAIRVSIPLIASPSAPTDLALKLANRANITVVGFVRGKKMNVYTHPGRII